MPNIRLEYSANLGQSVPLAALAAELHPMLARVAKASLGACRSRAYRAEEYYLAEGGAEGAFAHLTIALLPGRTPEQLAEVGAQALALLKKHLPAPDGIALAYAVEIVDIRGETYFR